VRRLLLLLLGALLLSSGTAEAMHVCRLPLDSLAAAAHPRTNSPCALCLTPHGTVRVAVFALSPQVFSMPAAPAAAPQRGQSRFVAFGLTVRPPPFC
jgi:hypothetical protein